MKQRAAPTAEDVTEATEGGGPGVMGVPDAQVYAPMRPSAGASGSVNREAFVVVGGAEGESGRDAYGRPVML